MRKKFFNFLFEKLFKKGENLNFYFYCLFIKCNKKQIIMATWEEILKFIVKRYINDVKQIIPIYDNLHGCDNETYLKLLDLRDLYFKEYKINNWPKSYRIEFFNIVRLQRDFIFERYPGYYIYHYGVNKKIYKYL